MKKGVRISEFQSLLLPVPSSTSKRRLGAPLGLNPPPVSMGSTPNANKGLKTSHPPLTTVTSFAAGFSRVFRSFRQPVFPLILTSKTFSNSLRVAPQAPLALDSDSKGQLPASADSADQADDSEGPFNMKFRSHFRTDRRRGVAASLPAVPVARRLGPPSGRVRLGVAVPVARDAVAVIMMMATGTGSPRGRPRGRWPRLTATATVPQCHSLPLSASASASTTLPVVAVPSQCRKRDWQTPSRRTVSLTHK